MSTTQTIVIRGKTSFAKILGDPILNYDKSGKEWKMDLQITKEVQKEMKAYGIADRVKTKEDYLDGEPYLTFKQKELKNNGSPNKPIKVTDIRGNPWDDSKLIGNGSDVDVKFVVMDFGPGKKKGVYIRSVRVLKLNEFNRKDFDDLDENDEFYQEALKAEEAAKADLNKFYRDFVDAPEELDDDVSDVGEEEL